MNQKKLGKKILDNNVFGPILIPIGIVLLGAILIFGVTSLLSTGKNHRDLVGELQSKAFGNKWVAAYELSKLIAGQGIPADDHLWVIDNLEAVYRQTSDERTREFVVVALSAFKRREVAPFLFEVLGDQSAKVHFHALVGISHLPKPLEGDFEKVAQFLHENRENVAFDAGLTQAAILVLAQHERLEFKELMIPFLTNQNLGLRYASSMALLSFGDDSGKESLIEIFQRPFEKFALLKLTPDQVSGLRINVLDILHRLKKTKPLAPDFQRILEAAEKGDGILSEDVKTVGHARSLQ
jgi:hypothetical protein